MPKYWKLITKLVLYHTIIFLSQQLFITSLSPSPTCDYGSSIFNFHNFYTSNCEKGGDLFCMGQVSQGDGFLNITTASSSSRSSSIENLNSTGRVLYNKPVQVWPASFCTSFSVRIFPRYNESFKFAGDGMTFVMAQNKNSSPNQSFGSYLGLQDPQLAGKTRFQQLAIEMDTFKNEWDPDDNHIAINTQSAMKSLDAKSLNSSHIDLKSGKQIRVKIEYNGWTKMLQIYVGYEGKPLTSFLNSTINVSETIPKNVYMGFTASTGSLTSTHQLLDWSFTSTILMSSNSNSLRKSRYRKRKLAIIILANVVVGCLVLLAPFIRRKMIKKRELIKRREELERQCAVAQRKFTYNQLAKATKNFSKDNLLGSGGFGSVYKGHIVDPPQTIAVKKISATSKQGDREYLAELSTIGRLRHRNILQLRGWNHEKEPLLLVYDFMLNKSLDEYITGKNVLDWKTRCKILTSLASALLYLHEECGDPIVHRDVKPNNVMLDEDFNPYLGDFGLARLLSNNTTGVITKVAGTLGYIAPELIYTSKATTASDVYSFGVLALEVVCGKRFSNFIEERCLMDYAWDMHAKGSLIECVDSKLGGGFEEEQVIRVLRVALACSHLDSNLRPKMRKVFMILSNYDEPLMELPNTRCSNYKQVHEPLCGISNALSMNNVDISSITSITLPR